MFAASLGIYDFSVFTGIDNEILGSLLLAVFLLSANVVLLNLLIAILSNIYSEVITRVDSEHRAVLMSYYDRWFWDKKYGVLIFTVSPLTYLTFLASPLLLLSSNPKPINDVLVKIFHFFYAFLIFLFFLIFQILIYPFFLIKGLFLFAYSKPKYS